MRRSASRDSKTLVKQQLPYANGIKLVLDFFPPEQFYRFATMQTCMWPKDYQRHSVETQSLSLASAFATSLSVGL